MSIRIYIFNFKKLTSKKKKSKSKNTEKAKETKEENGVFPENRLLGK